MLVDYLCDHKFVWRASPARLRGQVPHARRAPAGVRERTSAAEPLFWVLRLVTWKLLWIFPDGPGR